MGGMVDGLALGPRTFATLRLAAGFLAVLLVACTTQPPPVPSATVPPTAAATTPPATASSTPPASSAPARAVGPLALEACDPLRYIPCEHQDARLRVPVAGSGLYLTYSSECAAGRLDRPAGWDTTDLGLGGWSLDLLHRYDRVNGIDIDGRCAWRPVAAISLSGGGSAVPSFDGRYAYVFDGAGRHLRTVDALVGADLITFAYDEAGRLTSAHGSFNNELIELAVQRRPDRTITGLVGAGGSATSIVTDAAGQLAAVIGPDGSRHSFVTHEDGLLQLSIDPGGGLTGFDYDDGGRLVAVDDPDGVVLRYEGAVSASQAQVKIVEPLAGELVISARAMDAGIERTYQGPGGATTTMVEGADGQRNLTLPDGTRVSLGQQPDPRWGMDAPILTPALTQRPDGATRRTEVDETVEFSTDDPLRPTSWARTTTIDGNQWLERYDPAERSLTLTDPMGRATKATYDAQGRVSAYRAPGRLPMTYTFAADGRLASSTRGAGALAQPTSYSYDDAGRITAARPDGSSATLEFDAAGRVVRQTAGDGSSVLSTYDSSGQLILLRPGGGQSLTRGYSAAGRLTALVPAVVDDGGSYALIAYDDAGRVSAVTGPGSRQLAYAYDAAGRLSQVTFDRGQLTATYDPTTGQLAGVSYPGGAATSYRYSGPVRSAVAWSGPLNGSVALQLDSLDRIVGEAVNDGTPMAFGYDSAGALTSVGYVTLARDAESGLLTGASTGPVRLTWQYDENGQLSSATAAVNGSALLALDYARDVLGRVATARATVGSATHSTSYAYDGAGRLAGVTTDGATTEESSYDAAGNRSSVSSPGASLTADYDARNRLVRWGDNTYSYEPDGTISARTANGLRTTFDFDDLGSLRSVTLPDGRRVEYVVDWLGERVGRLVDGQRGVGFLYRPDGRVVAQLDASGQLIARFGYDDRGHLISLERDGRRFIVFTDLVGSPRLVIDAQSGEVVEAIEYDAWGRVTSDSNPGFQPFGLAGGLADADTGLLRFGFRDYDPTSGRWIQPDPAGASSGEANLYVYAGNDPINRFDMNGLRPDPPPATTNKGCFEEGGERICWTKDPSGTINYDLPKGGKYWFCEDGVCYVCGSGIKSRTDCNTEPQDPSQDLREPPPQPDPPADPPDPGDPGNGGGACLLAIYCGNHTCIALLCYPPGGGVCFFYCSAGDPHIRTADRLDVSFQGAGEYLMVTSADGDIVIQARQQPPLPTVTSATVTTALAMNVSGDRVGFYIDGEDLLLHINGTRIDGAEVAQTLPNGGTVTRHGAIAFVEWPEGSRLTINRQGVHLNYGFVPDPSKALTLTGLMGTPDGDATNDLVSRDRSLTIDPYAIDVFTQLHGQFGNSWRIAQQESLFDYAPGESSETFTLLDLPRTSATIEALDATTRASAEQLCRAAGISSEPTLGDCMVDVGLTGDPSYAASAAAVQASVDAAPPAAAPLPVGIGAIVSGVVVDPGTPGRYTFSTTVAQAIYLDALGSCQNDLSWRLVAPDGSTSGQEFVCHDLGRQELTETGTYIVEIFPPTGSQSTGPFAFTIRSAPPAGGAPIALGQPVSGQITEVGDQPTFTFDAAAGQVVYLDATGACVAGLTWQLLDPGGSLVATRPVCEDIGEEQLSAAGTYSIVVSSSEAVTGPFAFTAYAVPQPRTAGVTVGATVSDRIAVVGERHVYTFSASPGAAITLDAHGACVDGLSWRLLDPGGTGLLFGGTCTDLGPVTLPMSGTYAIEVFSTTTATGDYSFTLVGGT